MTPGQAIQGSGEVRSADGTTIRWLEEGSGTPLVLVPGGLGGEDAFEPLVRLLGHSFRCVTIGRRGKGFSDDGASYSYQREYEDVLAAVDAVGPPRLLLGHSSGAVCALGAALLAGVDRLVLVEPPLPLSGPLVTTEDLAAINEALQRGDVEQAVLLGLRNGVRMPPAALAARRARPDWPELVTRGAGWLREFSELNRLPVGAERYRAIETPTLLVWGTATPVHHRQAVEALSGVMPNAEVVSFEGYGHDVATAAAEKFAPVLLHFLLG
jgi:pimeloyl-ACP methyl ester carboxylesterase